jgi:hypothetical protein
MGRDPEHVLMGASGSATRQCLWHWGVSRVHRQPVGTGSGGDGGGGRVQTQHPGLPGQGHLEQPPQASHLRSLSGGQLSHL